MVLRPLAEKAREAGERRRKNRRGGQRAWSRRGRLSQRRIVFIAIHGAERGTTEPMRRQRKRECLKGGKLEYIIGPLFYYLCKVMN